MKTVKSTVNDSFREKGSKFIGYLFPAQSTDLFEEKLDQLKSKYPDATHHCYAYRIGPSDIQEFAQDDGEPGGTAGLPILNQLKSLKIVNAGLVVIRYYGGTKLGKSGLIKSYGYIARLCLDKAVFAEVIPTMNIQLIYPYKRQNDIDMFISAFNLTELDSEYREEVTLTMACPLRSANSLLNKLDHLKHLQIRYKKLEKEYFIKQ